MNKITHTDLDYLALDIIRGVKNLNLIEEVDITLKSINDAVTNVDMALQNIIKAAILKFDAKAIIISEENYTEIKSSNKPVWIIDPLDGTSNLIKQLKYKSVSIAKVNNNEKLAGLIIDLENMDTFTAIKSQGFLYNKKIPGTVEPRIKLLGASTGFLKMLIEKKTKVSQGWNVRVLGSQALQLCYVALGRLTASASIEAKAWDDVAGALIVEESRGYYFSDVINQSNWVSSALSNKNLKSVAMSTNIDCKDKEIILDLIHE